MSVLLLQRGHDELGLHGVRRVSRERRETYVEGGRERLERGRYEPRESPSRRGEERDRQKDRDRDRDRD